MKKIKLSVTILALFLVSSLLIGCDPDLMDELLAEKGYDEATLDQLEMRLESLEELADAMADSLDPDQGAAFEDQFLEMLENNYGHLEDEIEDRMDAVEADIMEKLDAGLITEEEALIMLTEEMTDVMVDVFEILEELIIFSDGALHTLAEEYGIDMEAVAAELATSVSVILTVNEPLATVNGVVYLLDQAPVIQSGRTLVPLRFIGEALDAGISWDADTRSVLYQTPDTTIVLTLDSTTATVNGVPTTLDVAPVSLNGRTMVPVRFVTETLGFKTDWLPETRQVVITSHQ